MGTQLGPLIISKTISTEDLVNKKLVVDTYNMLYQFLTTIRQADGSLLTDTHGRITSHLSGLFFRTANLLKYNIKLAFVFDGKSPDLKKEERDRRAQIKIEAGRKYELAASEGDLELMKKYASRTAILTKEMVEESKELIRAMGQPVIAAPSEGEAQAAYMVKKGDFYGLVSQDMDGLLFSSPVLIRNLSVSGKRKKAGTYEKTYPELISLAENLNGLGINIDQLIVIGILCGTDFNIGGVKGIGPKKALSLVKRHGNDFDALFKELNWEFKYSWKEVYTTIKNMPVTDNPSLKWSNIDQNKIYRLFVEKYDFSKERIERALDEITKQQTQKGLAEFY
jgi:flap endonuclease-1